MKERGLTMAWESKSTGNMTLAICDEKRVVLRVDMLRQKTIPAGDKRRKLCIAKNDLTVLTANTFA